MNSKHPDFELLILEQASTTGLPPMVSDGTVGPISVVCELFDSGFITGEPVRVESQNKHFQFLKITTSGRERLAKLKSARNEKTPSHQMSSVGKWLIIALALGIIGLLFDWLRKMLM